MVRIPRNLSGRTAIKLALAALALVIVGPRLFPQALAFPYRAEVAGRTVWSTQPIAQDQLEAVVAEAGRQVAKSPLARLPEARRVFLTDGGWRWTWLALNSRGAFAFSMPLGEAIVFNRSDLAQGTVSNGAIVGGTRSLTGTLAHETCHGMVRREIGAVASLTAPAWLVEGYCDHVAGESSLTAADVARLEAAGTDHPALPYYHGRQRVARALAANGGDVRALFENPPE